MSSETSPASPPTSSKSLLWTGRVLSALPIPLLAMSAFMKLTKAPQAVEGLTKFGYAESVLVGLGVVEVVCTVLYLIPQTSVLGAILLTGYLGGATATHLRVGDPFVIPIVFGVVLWLGLFLREPRLRAILPWRQ